MNYIYYKKTGAYTSLAKIYTPKKGDISEAKLYRTELQMQVVGNTVYWYIGGKIVCLDI